VTLRGAITGYLDRFAETTFTITVDDPCFSTTLLQPDPALSAMSTSVLVASGPVTQQIGVIKD